MKKLSSTMWLLLSILLIGAMSSCSKSSDLNQYLRSDAAMVISCSPKTFLENSDCKVSNDGIELSDALTDLMNGAFGSRDRKILEKILSAPGINYDKAVISVGSDLKVVVLMSLNDEGAFLKYVEGMDLDVEKENGVNVLVKERGMSVFVRDNVLSCFATLSGRFDVDDMEEYLSQAAENPLTSWQLDVLDKGNFVNGFIGMKSIETLSRLLGQAFSFDILRQLGFTEEYEAISNGYLRFHSDLDGTVIESEGELCNADGDEIDMSIKLPEVNTKLLKYATADDVFVVMASMPKNMNWSEFIRNVLRGIGMGSINSKDGAALTMVADVLDNIDGTIMLACGPKDVNVIDELNGWSGVLAVEMKEGKAEQYVKDIKTLLDKQIASMKAEADDDMFEPDEYMPSCEMRGGTLVISMSDYGTVCIKAEGKVFVAAIGEISDKGGCPVNADVFKGVRGGMAMNMPKQNAFSSIVELPFGLKGYYTSDGKKVKMRVEETEVKGNFFANIFSFVAGQVR